jgi:hypothetical protein
MTDPYKKETPDSLDDVEGEPHEQTGKPEDERVKRSGDLDQSESEAKDPKPDKTGSAKTVNDVSGT